MICLCVCVHSMWIDSKKKFHVLPQIYIFFFFFEWRKLLKKKKHEIKHVKIDNDGSHHQKKSNLRLSFVITALDHNEHTVLYRDMQGWTVTAPEHEHLFFFLRTHQKWIIILNMMKIYSRCSVFPSFSYFSFLSTSIFLLLINRLFFRYDLYV